MIEKIIQHFNLNSQYSLVKAFNQGLNRDLNLSFDLNDIDSLKTNVFIYRVRTNPNAIYPDVNNVAILLEKKKFIEVPVYSIENLKKNDLKIEAFEGNHGYGLAILFNEMEVLNNDPIKKEDPKLEQPKNNKHFKPFKR